MLNPVIALSLLSTSAAAGELGGQSSLLSFGSLALVFVAFYFLLIRPQKKREKEAQEMRKALQVGDEVVTAGGIIGRVVSLKDETIVIETGSDRCKIRVARWAVQSNNTTVDNTPSSGSSSPTK